ncbi:MAG: LL-diaminopimelate aminotransferase [Opitutales bacterium]|jgi:LL-diaminopimelate aminotransferase
MFQINDNYTKIAGNYLFAEVARRVQAFQDRNPGRPVIKMGIGDVTEPLPAACLKAFNEGVNDLGQRDTFMGYGPYEGYYFLRDAISRNDFQARGADIGPDEIFLSDGAKCDTGSIQELFSDKVRIAVPDPVYPVYVDSNVMAGRTGPFRDGRYEGLVYLDSTAQNGYVPEPPKEAVDVVYLCFPNNPTGAVATRAQLQAWVDYARANRALLLFDAAYEAFVRDPEIPRSIYEIEGAKEVAIEFRSFSKTAGFTGARAAFAVIPRGLKMPDARGDMHSMHALWMRRQSTRFNGLSYPVQRAAAAIYSPEGKAQVKALLDFYLENARLVREAIGSVGVPCVGGVNSPYLWLRPGGDSWAFFDRLLNDAGVVCTPGSGFGRCGEGHIRFSAFNSRKNVLDAIELIKTVLRAG